MTTYIVTPLLLHIQDQKIDTEKVHPTPLAFRFNVNQETNKNGFPVRILANFNERARDGYDSTLPR